MRGDYKRPFSTKRTCRLTGGGSKRKARRGQLCLLRFSVQHPAPAFKARTRKEERERTGLVELHHGHLWARSGAGGSVEHACEGGRDELDEDRPVRERRGGQRGVQP